MIQNRKEELLRKIEGAEGILDEHKKLAKSLVRSARRQFFLDRIWGAILALSHRNARTALHNNCKPLEVALERSPELEHLLNLADEAEAAELASRPTALA